MSSGVTSSPPLVLVSMEIRRAGNSGDDSPTLALLVGRYFAVADLKSFPACILLAGIVGRAKLLLKFEPGIGNLAEESADEP